MPLVHYQKIIKRIVKQPVVILISMLKKEDTPSVQASANNVKIIVLPLYSVARIGCQISWTRMDNRMKGLEGIKNIAYINKAV